MSFHEGDLQSGIAAAIQQQKAVLCFICDDSDKSAEWDAALHQDQLSHYINLQAVAIKLPAGSSEADFLTPICPVNSTPAVVVIKDAALQANIQSDTHNVSSLVEQLSKLFAPPEEQAAATSDATEQSSEPSNEPAIPATSSEPSATGIGYLDLAPSAGQPRLPNNAYDALREFTEGLKRSGEQPNKILEAQLGVLSRLPIFKDEVQRLRSLGPDVPLELSQTARDRLMLRLPAAAIKAQMKVQSTPSTQEPSPAQPATGRVYPPRSTRVEPARSAQPALAPRPAAPEVSELSAAQRQQQNEYRQIQRDREQKQRDERERIKAQIKADKEERRRRDQASKQPSSMAASTSAPSQPSLSTSPPNPPSSTSVRIQVRTFDGSVLRSTFPPSSTITLDLRPWIDSAINPNVPYDFKLILTPQPNKKIEASEEHLPLSDLGIRHSCTFVIAPVSGYVADSYSAATGAGAGAGGRLVGSALTGGYNLLAGTAGALFGGVSSLLGYGQHQPAPAQQGQANDGSATQARSTVRVRTLADQRAEENGRANQFYNGNTLNFEPNKRDKGKGRDGDEGGNGNGNGRKED